MSDDPNEIWKLARQAAVRGDLELSLQLIRSNAAYFERSIHFRLFELHQIGLLDRHEDALHLAEQLIAKLLLLARRNPNEEYFLVFAQWYGQVAYRSLWPNARWPTHLDFDATSVDLDNVELRWRRAFPMQIHPARSDGSTES